MLVRSRPVYFYTVCNEVLARTIALFGNAETNRNSRNPTPISAGGARETWWKAPPVRIFADNNGKSKQGALSQTYLVMSYTHGCDAGLSALFRAFVSQNIQEVTHASKHVCIEVLIKL